MAAEVPERFERDMAGSEADWLRLLPPALAPHPWQREDAAVNVVIGHGRLRITWVSLPPRRIALLSFPRLHVRFASCAALCARSSRSWYLRSGALAVTVAQPSRTSSWLSRRPSASHT